MDARLQRPRPEAGLPYAGEESEFRTDLERIRFAQSYSRLAEVTQVITAGATAGMVHNRLSHSIKVTAVARAIAVRLLREAGLTGFAQQFPCAGRRIDIAFVEARLAIEIDGFAYHSNRARFQADRTKHNALVDQGWLVLRFTWSDLTERPTDFLDSVRRHLTAR